jgi:hypothetical protein
VDQDVCFFSFLLDEFKGRLEDMTNFLVLRVVQIKGNVLELLGVLVMQINSRDNGIDVIFPKLFDIMSETEATDPDFPKISFFLNDLLTFVIVRSEHVN